MNQHVTEGIVLARTNFQEADRIITVLTKDHQKLRLMAKGVRKPKSKMAGGIELFATNHLTYLQGRKEMGTLISARILKQYGNIVKDLNRTMFGYELLKRVNRMTDEVVEPEYYGLLENSLQGLDDNQLPLEILEAWFDLKLLQLMGQQPNLLTDTQGAKLASGERYSFSVDDMAFAPSSAGQHDEKFIKLIRLTYAVEDPRRLIKIKDLEKLGSKMAKLVQMMARQHLPFA